MRDIENNNTKELKVKKFDLDKAEKIALFAVWFLLWSFLTFGSLYIPLDGIKLEKIMVIGTTMLIGVVSARLLVLAEHISKGKVVIEYFLYLIGLAGVITSLYISLSMGMWFFIAFVVYVVINSINKLKTFGIYSIMLFLISVYFFFTYSSILTLVMFSCSLIITPFTALCGLASIPMLKNKKSQMMILLPNQIIFFLCSVSVVFYLKVNQNFLVLILLGYMSIVLRFLIEKDHLTEEDKEEIREDMEKQSEAHRSEKEKILNILLVGLLYCLTVIPILLDAIKFYFYF